MKSFDQANERFENAVLKLRENLQHLADQGKMSDRFLNMQNNIIKSLIDYQHAVHSKLISYDQLLLDLSLKNSKAYQQLVATRESLEAICIIHGITDFPCWMVKGKSYLVNEAVIHYREGQVQLPYALMKLVNELPAHEQETLWNILNKKAVARWNQEFGKLKNRETTYA